LSYGFAANVTHPMQHAQHTRYAGVLDESKARRASVMAQSGPALGWIWARPWIPGLLGSLPIVGLFVLFIVTGVRGVDFGFHWDEAGWHTGPARQMIESGVLLPKSYIYPSFDKWLVLLPAIPRGVRAALDTRGDPPSIQAAMLAAMDAPGYLLRVRSVFIVVSSLGILWVYGAALALRHRRWEALVAAAGLALSWEYAYHSRWAVTDCILVQFSALTVFMLALFHRTGKGRWLYGAAFAAGLCTGTKYTGVFLLAPVLLASFLTLPPKALRAQRRRAVLICGLAFVVYLITTPATVLDPFMFMTETRGISEYYMHSHGGYTAKSAWHHAGIVLSYFGLAYFSPYPWIAAPAFVAVVAGAVLWLKRDLRFAAVLVGFPVLFLAMFCFRYRVVIIRNYLFVAPFFSLMLARGVTDLARWLPRPWLRWGFGAALLGVLTAQALWLVAAGESIRHIDPDAYVRQALDYVRDHGSIGFRLSNQVRALANAQHLALPPNVVKGRAGTEVVFFGQSEGPNPWKWRVNDPWLTNAVFGPREMNFNWYSSWSGHDRVVVMALDKARATGVPSAR
jgi:hypothetical protein